MLLVNIGGPAAVLEVSEIMAVHGFILNPAKIDPDVWELVHKQRRGV